MGHPRKEFHGGFCYDYCNFDYPLDILNMCWKEDRRLKALNRLYRPTNVKAG